MENGITRQRFSDAQLQELHAAGGDQWGSGQVMAKAGLDAGLKPTVIRGDDESYDELVAKSKGAGHSASGIVGGSLHAGEVAADVAAVHALEAGASAIAFAIIAPAAGAIAEVVHLREANVHGQELARAIGRDEAHVAMLAQLQLPESFRAAELAKYPEAGMGYQSAAQKMTSFLSGTDRLLAASLQVQCDRGSHAAIEARTSGLSPEGFLSLHPEIAKRCAGDAAFKAGFDAAVWAGARGGETSANFEANLAARDAAYARASISVRG